MTQILINVVVCVLIITLIYVMFLVKTYVDSKLTDDEKARIEDVIKTLVIAAENTIVGSGEDKNLWVKDQITKLGYGATDYVSAYIEKVVVEDLPKLFEDK